jgi:hypothetical protein
LLLLAACVIGLRVVHLDRPRPDPVSFATGKVVVVGVTGRYQLTDHDRAVLTGAAGSQVGAVSVRPRYIGDCAAAGWATLGSGRRTSVGNLCSPAVLQQRVTDWPQRQEAAAAEHGDALLGTLAMSVPGCVAAVGPGAALAAARTDGTLARYETAPHFVDTGLATPCPITLVDGGQQADSIIATLAARPEVSVIVTGIGPAAGTRDPGLEVIYSLHAIPTGWLTSTSTRRDGVVNLTDLTRTLVDFGQSGAPSRAVQIDGAPLEVRTGIVTVDALEQHLDGVAALSGAVLRADVSLGVGGAALLAILVLCISARRLTAARVMATLACVLPAAMVLTGAVPWYQTGSPGLLLTLLVTGLAVILTVVALLLANRVQVPVAVAGAALTVAALTVDALLGGVMQPGSMLNSRPVNGGRWYGFGNVTFAVYAAAALVLAGYVAHRLEGAGRHRAAMAGVAVTGFGVVVCDGWPSMGADFGGVVALTPGVLWLLLALSGLQVSWRKLLATGAAATLLVSGIAWLDWRRPPTARSHLGNFVQRIIDGDAQDIVLRKAVAAGTSVVTPLGIGSVVVGIALWVLFFRRVLPALADQFRPIRQVAVAALVVAVLGTLVNDGGITVWYTLTGSFTITVAALSIDRAYQHRRARLRGPGHGAVTHRWVPRGSAQR